MTVKSPDEDVKTTLIQQIIYEKLSMELQEIIQQRQTEYDTLLELLKLENHLETLKANDSLKTMMDVGCHVFMKCKIENTKRIIMNVGLDYYCEVGLEEAQELLSKHKKRIDDKVEQLSTKIAAKRVQISSLFTGTIGTDQQPQQQIHSNP